jgi:hypothetical protein
VIVQLAGDCDGNTGVSHPEMCGSQFLDNFPDHQQLALMFQRLLLTTQRVL